MFLLPDILFHQLIFWYDLPHQLQLSADTGALHLKQGMVHLLIL